MENGRLCVENRLREMRKVNDRAANQVLSEDAAVFVLLLFLLLPVQLGLSKKQNKTHPALFSASLFGVIPANL